MHLTQTLACSYALEQTPSGRRLRRQSVPRFAILCYHRVGTGGVPLYSELPAEMFEAQMRHLKKNYRVISLDRMIQEISDPASLAPTVAITFDDGYRGLYTEAFPILRKYNIPATVFLTVEPIETCSVAWYDRIFLALHVAPQNVLEITLDQPRRFELSSPSARMRAAVEIITWFRSVSPQRRKEGCAALEKQIQLPADALRDRMLAWDQIQTMHRAGISFGGHTMTHPVVSRLSPTELDWEISESTRILEQKLDAPVRHFAFPFGKRDECSDAAIRLLAQRGYHSAGTTEWGLNSTGSDSFLLRRIQIGEIGSLAMFAFQLNRLFLSPGFAQTGALHRDASSTPVANQAAVAEPQRVGR